MASYSLILIYKYNYNAPWRKGAQLDKVRVGFVGAGVHANAVHYPSLASMKDVEIVAICDINLSRLRSTSKKYGVELQYTDYKKMFEEVKLDAVYIIMPPHQLYDIVIDALRHGFNVFIEKPPGITAFQTESMARYARKYRCKTMVGFNRRFIPLLRKVKKIVTERGPILQAVAVFYKHRLGEEPYFRGAVDILTCDAIHAVDTLRWIGGDVERVVSVVKRFHCEYDNAFYALMRFKTGGVGILMSNWAAGKRIHVFEMHSKGISASINPDDKALIYMDNKEDPLIITTQEAAGSNDRIWYYGFYFENRHFIDCIKNDTEPEVNFEEAAKTMRLIKLIYNSQMS
ncbi:MAG: gfo/Idh/MocA family oxidoreductase [Thermoprotei archaeon]|nr:MAG: gfo/Idh/MocA family oxidoreductase [Thermoprotei archaeon]